MVIIQGWENQERIKNGQGKKERGVRNDDQKMEKKDQKLKGGKGEK